MRVIILFFINWNLLAGYLPDQEVANRLKLLDYNKSFKVISFKKYRTKRKYEIFRVKLRTENANPALKGPLITEFFWYRPKLSMVQAKARPLIVISPPIVGVDPLEKALSHNFTSREPYYNTFILIYSEKINDKNRPISKLDESFIKSIVQGRILLDFAETQPKYIDAKKNSMLWH